MDKEIKHLKTCGSNHKDVISPHIIGNNKVSCLKGRKNLFMHGCLVSTHFYSLLFLLTPYSTRKAVEISVNSNCGPICLQYLYERNYVPGKKYFYFNGPGDVKRSYEVIKELMIKIRWEGYYETH